MEAFSSVEMSACTEVKKRAQERLTRSVRRRRLLTRRLQKTAFVVGGVLRFVPSHLPSTAVYLFTFHLGLLLVKPDLSKFYKYTV